MPCVKIALNAMACRHVQLLIFVWWLCIEMCSIVMYFALHCTALYGTAGLCCFVWHCISNAGLSVWHCIGMLSSMYGTALAC